MYRRHRVVSRTLLALPCTFRYYQVSLCTVYCVPCAMYRRVSSVISPVFALPYLGQRQVCMYLSLPYSGTSHWSAGVVYSQVLSGTQYLQHLSYPIWGKASRIPTRPFPIWGQVSKCPRLSCIMSAGIRSFPIRDRNQCFACLYKELNTFNQY